MDFNLGDYRPTKIEDEKRDFETMVTKNQLVTANVNHARIEEYDGDREDMKGLEFLRYELQVTDDPQGKYVGRKLWKSVPLNDTEKLKKLADQLFTAFGVEFTDKPSLEKACEQIVDQPVAVRAWGWTPPDGDKELQMHTLKAVEAVKPTATASF